MKVLQTISGLTTKSGGPSTCTHDLMVGLQEIGDALDMPINTVKTKIRRAKAQLLKMMDYSDELL